MSKHQNLLFYSEKWAEDCSSFLINKKTFCDCSFIFDGKIFDSLNVQVSDEEQKMVKQCLEMIFGGFGVSRQMLYSHLKEEMFVTITEELKHKASSVITTNAAAERDFTMVDRLKRCKPRIVYEGMTIFSLNKPNHWRDRLSQSVLHKAMEFARKSKQHENALYFQGKKTYFWKSLSKCKETQRRRTEKEKLLLSEKNAAETD